VVGGGGGVVGGGGGAGGDSVGGGAVGGGGGGATPNSGGSFNGGGGHVGTPWAERRARQNAAATPGGDHGGAERGQGGQDMGGVTGGAMGGGGGGGSVQVTTDCWVTVYGFAANDTTTVLSEFQRDGDIMYFDSFENGASSSSAAGGGGGSAANWVHVRFASREGAQRALQRNGQRVSGASIMVGVKPLDAAARAVIVAEHGGVGLGPAPEGGSGGGGGGGGEGGGSRMVRPAAGMTMPAARAYRVQPSRAGIMLQPQRSWWGKVVEFIFGM
jgi:hypothetical protein